MKPQGSVPEPGSAALRENGYGEVAVDRTGHASGPDLHSASDTPEGPEDTPALSTTVRRAWLPLPFLLGFMILFAVSRSSFSWESPWLLLLLNVPFTLLTGALIAYLVGRSFLDHGGAGLLLLGCGVVFWSGSSVVALLVGRFSELDHQIAFHNTSVWLSGLCHLGGVLLNFRSGRRLHERGLWLTGAYAACCCVLCMLVVSIQEGWIPVFFVQGHGGTPVRHAVLGTAVVMFMTTAWLVLSGQRRRGGFAYWYGLALALVALGLLALLFQSSAGSLLNWTGRAAQVLGGVYMLVAGFAAAREAGAGRVLLERDLEEKAEQYTTVLQLATDGVVIHELPDRPGHGRFVQVNNAMCKLLGYTAGELRQLSPADISLPRDVSVMLRRRQELLRNGVLRHEVNLRARDGRVIPCEINSQLFKRRGDRLVLSLVRDISERKQAEQALRESEARARLLGETMLQGVVHQNADGIIIAMNPAAEEILGKSKAEFLGSSSVKAQEDTIREDGSPFPGLEHPSMVCLRTGHPQHGVTMGVWNPRRKERRWISVDAVPVFDKGGDRPAEVYTVFSDVTERRQAQESLRQSEERLKLALSAVRLATWDWNVQTGAVVWNDEHFRMMGYAPGSVTPSYQAWADRVHPDDAKAAADAISAAVKQGGHFQLSFRALWPDGTIRWIEVQGYTEHDSAGQPLRNGGVMSDVTEKTLAEQALRASEEKMRSAFAGAAIGFALTTPEGRYLEVNPAYCRVTGYSPAELIGQNFPQLLHPEDAARNLELNREMQAGIRDRFVIENRYIRKDGREVWVRKSVAAVNNREGVRQWNIALVEDITERKEAEAELRERERLLEESRQRLQAVLSATGVGLWLNTLPLGSLSWDARTRELFFIAPEEEATVDLFWSRLHPDDREPTRVAVDRALREKGIYAIDHRAVDPKSGRVRWIHSEGRVICDPEGNPVRFDGINYDVTERKQFQAELERVVAQRTAELQELVGELEHFSYTITHDLKAPLRAMKGYGEVIGEVLERNGNPEDRDFLRRIMGSADRMDALIRDALNYSRAVRQELPLEDVNTHELLDGMLDTYPELQRWKAHIRVEGKLPVVLANEAGLIQCFSNLLGNAIKFVKAGQTPEIRIWSEEQEGWTRFCLEDKGIGISREMLPRVFDMFARGSKNYEGTGIGLALVRKVVQRMGGRLGVESEEGGWTRFWLELKTGKESRFPVRAAGAQTPATGTGTVLYVEDEENDAIFMERAFEIRNMTSALRLAPDGHVAIEYLSGSGKYGDRKEYPLPALVLLDLNLPQVTGFEVLQWMRNHPAFARTPVVVFSSSTREDDHEKAHELGANDFICKPKSGLEFGSVVEELKARWHI